MFTLLYGEFTQDNTHLILLGSAWFRLRYEKITLWCVFRLTVYIHDGYQLLLLAGCFENFRVLSYVFIV